MIRAAIVGIGTWRQHLASSVQGRREVIRFVAGTTRTRSRATDFASRHQIALVDSYEQLLQDPAVDTVVLATPHSMRVDEIVAAARAGKHVFTEKPLGLDPAATERAVRACAEHGVTLAVGYNWRFQPALQEARRMLEDGTLGRL